jgi:hypothetical protein
MEVRFCDICNESVPQGDLDAGRAFMRNGRVVCASCDLAMSPGPGSAGSDARQVALVGGAQGSDTAPRPSGPGFEGGARAANGARGDRPALWVACMALVGVGLATWLADRDTLELQDRERSARLALEQNTGRARALLGARLDRFERELGDNAAELRAEVEGVRHTAAAGAAATAEGLEWIAALEARTAALEAAVEDLRRSAARPAGADQELPGRVTALEADLLRLQEDLGVLVRSVLDGMAEVEVSSGEPPVGVAEAPAWRQHLVGLDAEDPLERWDAVQALASSGDPAAGAHLAARLTDPDLFVRMAAARALGELGASDAVPALIEALEDAEPSVREAAVLALRTITGRNFRFDPAGTPGDRARRAAAWRDWWNRSGGRGEDS